MQVPPPAAEAGLPIAFDGVLVVVGGGEVDAVLLRALAAEGAHLVGADGGGDVIAAAGLAPEAIIGDLDSLADAASWAGRTRLVHLAEQQTTDFEKVLYSTRAPVTVALGMTGGRFDHTLAALDVVARYARGRHIVLIDTSDLAFAATGAVRFEVAPGERVSIHPLARVRFAHSEGLLYPLDGLEFAPGEGTGTSNAATGGPVGIVPEPGQGAWLLILRRQYLQQLLAGLAGL